MVDYFLHSHFRETNMQGLFLFANMHNFLFVWLIN